EVHKAGGGRYWIDPPAPSTPRNTDNADNDRAEPIEKIGADDEPIFDADNGPITDGDNAGTSNRHKCWYCRERGETLQVVHGIAKPRLHRECIDAWIADYEERVA
ncbi:unnamed protein product, partial [Phaeothamnion confervicola]